MFFWFQLCQDDTSLSHLAAELGVFGHGLDMTGKFTDSSAGWPSWINLHYH